jgi:stage V sporulation protein AC
LSNKIKYEVAFGMDMEKKEQKEYEEYVKSVTPTHNLWVQMLRAFVTGGIICLMGQVIQNIGMNSFGLDKQTASSWCSVILILESILLTGLNIYPQIVKWGGAGALVPITGFANSVAAPAIEFKKEGQVFGVGCKIFTIAGPVILYGIFTSWVLGFVYWLGKITGIA